MHSELRKAHGDTGNVVGERIAQVVAEVVYILVALSDGITRTLHERRLGRLWGARYGRRCLTLGVA
jgi:hypothetical protein